MNLIKYDSCKAVNLELYILLYVYYTYMMCICYSLYNSHTSMKTDVILLLFIMNSRYLMLT